MNAINSTYTAFDKRRTRFSDWIVHYAVLFILLIVSLLVMTYYVANDRLQESQQASSELHDISFKSLQLIGQWRDLDPASNGDLIPELLQQERMLSQRLRAYNSNINNLPSAPVTISQFTVAEQVQLAVSRLSQIKHIAIERSSRLGQLDILQHPLVLSVMGGWGILLFYLMWGWRRMLQDRQAALGFFHFQIDRSTSGGTVSVPSLRNDEFGDFSRYLESYLTGISAELETQKAFSQLYQSAMSSSLSLKLLINERCEILSVSEGMSELWVLESEPLSDFLGVDVNLSNLEGEVISESLISGQSTDPLRIGKNNYEVRCSEINTCKQGGYLVEFVLLESHAELRVLEATLSLMSNDVWDAPIRILDSSSPYYSFSTKLEASRRVVFDFLAHANELVENRDKEYPKITKLQQLSAWLVATLNDNEVRVNEKAESNQQLTSEIEISQQDFLQVREQIENRFELYEAYLQQLVEWQASQSTWVAMVNEGLLDTKEAILNLLSIVHTEPSSASAIEHSVIDLAHDIDTVLADILESKPAPGDLRLEHIKSSESDLMRRLNDVQSRLDHVSDLAQQQQGISHH